MSNIFIIFIYNKFKLKSMSNLKFYLGAIVSYYLAYITGTGEILNYVPFADPLNEMAFFVLMIMSGTGFLMCTKDC